MCCSQHLQDKIDLVEKKNKARLPEKSKECLTKRPMNLFRKSLETIGRETETEISLKEVGEGMELGDKAVVMKYDINRKGKMG